MLLFAVLLASAAPESLGGLPLERTIALEGQTHHVQGLAVRDGTLWVSSVDRDSKRGYLSAYDERTGKMVRSVEVQQGERYHPGGVSLDGDSIWVPVAEYRRDGTSTIQQRSLRTLEVIRHFEVPDHIGCVAVTPDALVGGNWDARKLYRWTREGRQLQSQPNPLPLHIQDWKFVGGTLVASGLSGKAGEIRWLDPQTLATRRILSAGLTDRNVAYTHEGMEISGNRLYLLPEDSPSRVFVFILAP